MDPDDVVDFKELDEVKSGYLHYSKCTGMMWGE